MTYIFLSEPHVPSTMQPLCSIIYTACHVCAIQAQGNRVGARMSRETANIVWQFISEGTYKAWSKMRQTRVKTRYQSNANKQIQRGRGKIQNPKRHKQGPQNSQAGTQASRYKGTQSDKMKWERRSTQCATHFPHLTFPLSLRGAISEEP